jgi:hypothetical protein
MGSGLGRVDEAGRPPGNGSLAPPIELAAGACSPMLSGSSAIPPLSRTLRERRVTGPVSIYDLALENRAGADRD